MDNTLNIRQLEMNHIKMIIKALYKSDINRSEDYFNLCLLENELHKRITLLAFCQKDFAGYINIIFNSKYPYFYKNRIPEISDFFVLPQYREKGIGTRLLQSAENIVANKYGSIGIGVGLYEGYDSTAQKLYVSNGYLPDTNNSSSRKCSFDTDDYVRFDDDFVVFLYKKLK